MEGNSDKGYYPPLQIDPKWCVTHDLLIWSLTAQRNSIQDALRTFLPPINNDGARLGFYTAYKKEAAEYDADYVRKYSENLNTIMIFVRRGLIILVLSPSDFPHRRVSSLSSAQRLLSTLNRIFSLIRPNSR